MDKGGGEGANKRERGVIRGNLGDVSGEEDAVERIVMRGRNNFEVGNK